LASYRAAATALDPYEKEVGELNAKLDPLKKQFAAVTDEYNRQLASGGADPDRMKQLSAEIDNLATAEGTLQNKITAVGEAWREAKVAEAGNSATAKLNDEKAYLN